MGEALPEGRGANEVRTTMQRRKFIAGLGSLTAAGAAGIGTGAFANVSASRTAHVDTAADANAYLGINATSGYASGTSSGTLTLDFSDANSNTEGTNAEGEAYDGQGLNTEAITSFSDLFEITNQGTKDVAVFIDDAGYWNPDNNTDSDGDESPDTTPPGSAVPAGYPSGDLNEKMYNNGLIGYPNRAGFFTDSGDITAYSDSPLNADVSGGSFSGHTHVLSPGESVSVSWYVNTKDANQSTSIAEIDDASIALWAFTPETASDLQSSQQ